MRKRIPADQDQRDTAVYERKRNVIIDAGAGTGKTTIVVDRLVSLLAPADHSTPLDINRIAAVTFTRRAAGELRLRIREALVRSLAEPEIIPKRHDRLRSALSGLDTAYIGTVHSFADRLLRLRPVEAELSPAYEIAEDVDGLVRETYDRLLRGTEMETLADELGGSVDAELIAEAQETLIDAVAVGLRAQRRESEFYTWHGLDSLVEGFILQRDCPPAGVDARPKLDLKAISKARGTVRRRASRLSGRDHFSRAMRRLADKLEELDGVTDGRTLYPELVPRVRKIRKRGLRMKDCTTPAWEAWKAFTEGIAERNVPPIADMLLAPLEAWMAQRLVRLSPVVVALYDQVKGRHGVVDQIDLLLQLRNLLQRDRSARKFYQGMFDHVFVDEFQDTDPLQAEVLIYLCEKGAKATDWTKAKLRAGSLTVVGDPKQSIYRFRRADVATYDEVRRLLKRTSVQVELSTNFRSTPKLIEWLNHRMEPLLGRPRAGRSFAADTGQVYHKPLSVGRHQKTAAAVHMLPLLQPDGDDTRADAYRLLEGRAAADYLRWLVDRSGLKIADPQSNKRRTIEWGDIAVLSLVTTHLSLLSRELDTQQIPHTLSGGRLFLQDPLHQQFLLGLRAIADPDDGVAQAALYRPPFFAVDLGDHYRLAGGATDDGVERLEAARAHVRELKRRRFERAPGATARDLLDGTAFARIISIGPNGAQRMRRLRELCHLLDIEAAAHGLDYDGVTALLRGWLDEPPQINAPRPVEGNAVQVMTVHQAKGLEFPVVVLWDGMALLRAHSSAPPWRVDRNSGAWSMALDGLEHCEPPGIDLADVEKKYRNHERRRVVYVACTRARDLLVLPRPAGADQKHISGLLLEERPEGTVRRLDTYGVETPDWAASAELPTLGEPASAASLENEVDARWQSAAAKAAQPRFQPGYVSVVSKETRAVSNDEDDVAEPPKWRESRFGSAFGSVVHRAIELCFASKAVTAAAAVAQAAREHDLSDHLHEVEQDVGRVLDALEQEGITPPMNSRLRLEYPIAGQQDGRLLLGTIDLVAAERDELIVIDFKTDAPPTGAVESALPGYVEQLRTYARLLTESTGTTAVRTGLLFSADGNIRWIPTASEDRPN